MMRAVAGSDRPVAAVQWRRDGSLSDGVHRRHHSGKRQPRQPCNPSAVGFRHQPTAHGKDGRFQFRVRVGTVEWRARAVLVSQNFSREARNFYGRFSTASIGRCAGAAGGDDQRPAHPRQCKAGSSAPRLDALELIKCCFTSTQRGAILTTTCRLKTKSRTRSSASWPCLRLRTSNTVQHRVGRTLR